MTWGSLGPCEPAARSNARSLSPRQSGPHREGCQPRTGAPSRWLSGLQVLSSCRCSFVAHRRLLRHYANYQRAAALGVLTEDLIARLYQVAAADVALCRLPNMRVIKASFPRPVVQGSFADRDMHSVPQHIPLAKIPCPMTEDE